MNVIEKKILAKDYLTKSNLPASDYVINPYVGCPHACKYCYARFMKRFTGHEEEWGSFLDIKECTKPINTGKLVGKSLFIASVTDCYNPLEEKYKVTGKLLEQLAGVDCQITISTKSGLICRDLELLEKLPHLKVAFSVNTLDEAFRKDMDRADTIKKRLTAMTKLHHAGIYTVLFMSPIFPYITEWKEIIDMTRDIAHEYWFENLNLRGAYKREILNYIAEHYPQFVPEYTKIYRHNDMTYWQDLARDLDGYCQKLGVTYTNYFYHKELIKRKKNI